MSKKLRPIILLITSTCASVAFAQAEQSKSGVVATKQVMGEVYESLQAVLPLSLSREKFEDPKEQEFIRKNLKKLADGANLLPKHTEFKDGTFRYLGGSLARDAKDIYRRFERGNSSEAMFLLGTITDNCVACHSRFPSADSTKAQGLFKNTDLQNMPASEKARLYLVTRQFDNSMNTYRDVILSRDNLTDQICVADWVSDYLVVAIRVKRDFAAAKDTLTKFLARNDLPLYFKHDVESWVKSIDQLSKRKSKANLPTIRKLFNEAKQQSQFPFDRQGLIQYLLASSLLNQYVTTLPKGIQAAEAYYLLGLAESMTGKSYWLSQTEYYLETAIRSAPGSIFAERAYRKLEENTLFENSGSSGTHIPDDVQANLEDLLDLILAAKKLN